MSSVFNFGVHKGVFFKIIMHWKIGFFTNVLVKIKLIDKLFLKNDSSFENQVYNLYRIIRNREYVRDQGKLFKYNV